MSNSTLEVKAISGHRGGTPGGGTYMQPDGKERSGLTRDYDVCKLVDTTTCIGCKACEVACVEWNGYEFYQTTFDNTYQTMPETAWNFWNLIKFDEYTNDDGNVQWLMRKDQCMHCEEPGCLIACPADGAIVQYTNGIVDFNQANCIGCQYCVTGCPFNIPKFNSATKKVYKCTLCSDRVGAAHAFGIVDARTLPRCIRLQLVHPFVRLGEHVFFAAEVQAAGGAGLDAGRLQARAHAV